MHSICINTHTHTALVRHSALSGTLDGFMASPFCRQYQCRCFVFIKRNETLRFLLRSNRLCPVGPSVRKILNILVTSRVFALTKSHSFRQRNMSSVLENILLVFFLLQVCMNGSLLTSLERKKTLPTQHTSELLFSIHMPVLFSHTQMNYWCRSNLPARTMCASIGQFSEKPVRGPVDGMFFSSNVQLLNKKFQKCLYFTAYLVGNTL